MRAPRFRLRTIMLGIALVAVSISGGRVMARWVSRSIEYRRIAAECRAIEAQSAANPLRACFGSSRRQVAYAGRSALEYERAAWRPWCVADPDAISARALDFIRAAKR